MDILNKYILIIFALLTIALTGSAQGTKIEKSKLIVSNDFSVSSNAFFDKSITFGGVARTNWPFSAENWYLYPALANVNFGGFRGTNLAYPVGSNDLANKQYIDDQINSARDHTSLTNQNGNNSFLHINNIEKSLIGSIQPSVQGNILISGGVTWLSNLTFQVSPLVFRINGDYYTNSGGIVTLPNADATYDRIDVIVGNTNGTVGFTNGIANANPSKPNIDESSQIEVTFVTVPAGATAPSVSSTKIFAEGTEWYMSSNSTTVKIVSNEAKFGTKSVAFSNSPIYTWASFTNVAINVTTNSQLTFWVKIKTWPAGMRVGAIFVNTYYANGMWVDVLKNGNYGFSIANTNWQSISVPMGDFRLTYPNVDRIYLYTWNGNSTFYLDDIAFQGGVPSPVNSRSFATVTGNSGSVTASSANDILNIVGTDTNDIITTINSKTVFIKWVASNRYATVTALNGVSNLLVNTSNSLHSVDTNLQAQIDAINSGNSFITTGSTAQSKSGSMTFSSNVFFNRSITFGGVLRTNWPASAENWYLYAAGTNVNFGGFRGTNLAYPIATNDAATKGYVDSSVTTITNNYSNIVQEAVMSSIGGTNAFSINLSANVSALNNTEQVVPYNQKYYDEANGYNTNTYRYTVKKSGFWRFMVSILVKPSSSPNGTARLYKVSGGKTSLVCRTSTYLGGNYATLTIPVRIVVTNGDSFYVTTLITKGGSTLAGDAITNGMASWFEGMYLQ